MFAEQLRRAVEASPHAELPARMAHPLLPFPRPAPRRSRSNRRPFTPSPCDGPYRLPRDVQDRLTTALAPFRSRPVAETAPGATVRWSCGGYPPITDDTMSCASFWIILRCSGPEKLSA